MEIKLFKKVFRRTRNSSKSLIFDDFGRFLKVLAYDFWNRRSEKRKTFYQSSRVPWRFRSQNVSLVDVISFCIRIWSPAQWYRCFSCPKLDLVPKNNPNFDQACAWSKFRVWSEFWMFFWTRSNFGQLKHRYHCAGDKIIIQKEITSTRDTFWDRKRHGTVEDW